MSESITFTRDEYKKALPDWQLMDDVCNGERAIKNRETTYLPKPNPTDKSPENSARYAQYLARAVFYNATGRTLSGLMGSAFRRWPIFTAPALLQYLEKDADGSGVSIYQQSQAVLHEVLKKARHGLLTDFPTRDGDTSQAAMNSGRFRANILSYDAEQIINWKTTQIGGVYKLSLVVLSETIEKPIDDFATETIKQIRVLRLIDGVYWVEIYQLDDKQWSQVESFTPRDSAGRLWDEIPFSFVGAVNNDVSIDQAPLLDLARLNIAHYRNSADFEDSTFFVGQVQPWLSGLDENWRDHLEKSGLYIGSRSPVLLPQGGQFGFAQAQPNSLVETAMNKKERQMIALGARVIEQGQASKTATQANNENEVQHSQLSLAVNNVNDAYALQLAWAARFMGAAGEIDYTINQDFIEHTLDAQMLTALVGAWQSGQLPSTDFWANMRKYSVIDPDKTDEEIKEELSNETAGLGLDGDQ